MKPFIVVGDKTSHGGVVIEGSPTNDIDGKAIARVGDKVTCPKRGCHSPTVIVVSGDVSIIVDGKPVALHGDKTACGATLISSQLNTNSDPQGGAGSSAGTTASASSVGGNTTANESNLTYDEQTHLVAPMIEGLPYFIETSDGRTFSGRAAAHGKLPRIETANSDEYTVHWGDEALAKIGEAA